MRNTLATLLVTLFMGSLLTAQVKIGDNPQNIDPASVLELESTDKVLVITRVTTAQMNAIVPSQGALCYNTELQAVHYYDGTQWLNIGNGGGTGGPLTADPIVNPLSTIVITPTATGDNLEVAPNSISSEQIIDGGVNGIDIQDGSIGPGKLQNNSVTEDKLSENSVGAFALDNDNIGVSAFNNDVGYITAGDLNSSVSTDAPNSISVGSDGGALYDDTNLMNDVLDNAAAIALDNDQNPTNELQNLIFNATSNILTLSTPATAGNQIDLSSLAGTGGSTEVVDNATLTGLGTAGDPFKIEPAATFGRFLSTDLSGNVLWADLPTGSGGTVSTDGITILGNGLAGSPLLVPAGGITTTQIANATILAEDLNQMMATDGQVLTWDDAAGFWAPADSGGGGNQNLGQVLAQGTDGGAALIKNILDPVDPQDAATRAYVDATVASGGSLLDGTVLIGGAGDTAQQLAISGDATLANDGALTIEDDAITTVKILDANVTTAKIAPAADLMPAADQMLITNDAGVVEWAPLASHTGTANYVFFADTDGTPTTTEDNAFTNDDGDFFWDPEGRKLGGTNNFGALYIGLQNAVPTTDSKVHIADNFPGVAYALKLQNTSATVPGRSTGILFSTELLGDYGKGALVYEYQNSFARGDFHLLQNSTLDTSNPTLTDKAFTVKNNKDIVLYAGIDVDNTGTVTGLGAAGQVLSSQGVGNGLEWINAGGLPTATGNDQVVTWAGDDILTPALEGAWIAGSATSNEQDISLDVTDDEIDLLESDGSTVSSSIKLDGVTLEAANDGTNDVIRIKPLTPTPTTNQMLITNTSGDIAWATAGGDNLSTENLTQETEDRTYDLNGQNLNFLGTGNVAIGNFDNDPGTTAIPAISTDKLDVNGQIRARNGFAASPGNKDEPSYSFYTDDDSNTGIYRAGPDQMGFSTGGNDAIRIDAAQNVGIGTTTPNSTLHIGGSFAAAITTTTGNLTLNNTHHTILLGGTHDITLPAAATNQGRIYIIKNATGTFPTISNYLNSDGIAWTTIEGGVTQLQSDGTNWQQIN